MEASVPFGPWLKQLRTSRDLTQEELATQVGCAVETIRKLEAGVRRPSKEIAHRLAEVLFADQNKRQRFVERARGLKLSEVGRVIITGRDPDDPRRRCARPHISRSLNTSCPAHIGRAIPVSCPTWGLLSHRQVVQGVRVHDQHHTIAVWGTTGA
jgi:transcriptional regulator with XRE-family HTH domain